MPSLLTIMTTTYFACGLMPATDILGLVVLSGPRLDQRTSLGSGGDPFCVAEVSELDLQVKDGAVQGYRAKVKVSFKYEAGA